MEIRSCTQQSRGKRRPLVAFVGKEKGTGYFSDSFADSNCSKSGRTTPHLRTFSLRGPENVSGTIRGAWRASLCRFTPYFLCHSLCKYSEIIHEDSPIA